MICVWTTHPSFSCFLITSLMKTSQVHLQCIRMHEVKEIRALVTLEFTLNFHTHHKLMKYVFQPSAAQRRPAAQQVPQESVQQLTEMGFSQAKAIAALKSNANDFLDAVNWLDEKADEPESYCMMPPRQARSSHSITSSCMIPAQLHQLRHAARFTDFLEEPRAAHIQSRIWATVKTVWNPACIELFTCVFHCRKKVQDAEVVSELVRIKGWHVPASGLPVS